MWVRMTAFFRSQISCSFTRFAIAVLAVVGAGAGSEAGAGVGTDVEVDVKADKLEAGAKSEVGVLLSISVTVSSKTLLSYMLGRLGGRLLSPTKIGQNVGSMLLRLISTYCF